MCVYPTYIDSDKSVTDGRKVAKNKAVKDPRAYHMAVAVQMLDWAYPGRVKVKLFDLDTHHPMVSSIRNRKLSST